MKLAWRKRSGGEKGDRKRYRSNPDLPFESEIRDNDRRRVQRTEGSSEWKILAESLQWQGNELAEKGMYREALAKWDAALRAYPENAVLHEQKGQVLLEIGDAWGAVKAATRATKLNPSWAEAWITLARAQLNYGEPEAAIVSFDEALMLKPDSQEAKMEKDAASQLVEKRNQLQSSCSSVVEGRISVVDKVENL